jgi:hypothetical protein
LNPILGMGASNYCNDETGLRDGRRRGPRD